MTQQHYSRTRTPVRTIPTKEQLAYAARRQAQLEADTSYAGYDAGIHPEGDYELEEDERYYATRLPSSAKRYGISAEQVVLSGDKRYHVRVANIPKRKSRQELLPPRERYTEEVEQAAPARARTRLHPLAWFGLFLTLLILGWIGLNAFTSWYQGVRDDLTYGEQRHFAMNYVVGHNDSSSHPSHFTAENNNGQIIVIELPGGDVSHARIYPIETVPGNIGNPPVKLSFADMNNDGKVDMIVQIGDTNAVIYLTLFNNGSQFVSRL